jgi:hypothetical protein
MPYPGQQLLYTLGHSPICVNEVEKSLENYPYKDIACELKKGLTIWLSVKLFRTEIADNLKEFEKCC